LIPSSFRGNEFQAIADAIHDALQQHPEGLTGLVMYARRAQQASRQRRDSRG
jgi:hypothetical protein